MSEIVYLNGEFMPLEEARIPVLDRGFIFGDGVYEVIPVYSSNPFRLPEHLARFERSHEAIRIANPLSDAEWTRLVHDLDRAQCGRRPVDLPSGHARRGEARSRVSRRTRSRRCSA